MGISITDTISLEAAEACEDAGLNPDEPITTIYITYGDWADSLIAAGADTKFVTEHIRDMVKGKKAIATSSHRPDAKETIDLLAGDYREEHAPVTDPLE